MLVVIPGPLVVGLSGAAESALLNWSVAAVALLLIARWFVRRGVRPDREMAEAERPAFDDYEWAFLAGGAPRVLWTAVVTMLGRGQARLDDNRIVIDEHDREHDVERTVRQLRGGQPLRGLARAPDRETLARAAGPRCVASGLRRIDVSHAVPVGCGVLALLLVTASILVVPRLDAGGTGSLVGIGIIMASVFVPWLVIPMRERTPLGNRLLAEQMEQQKAARERVSRLTAFPDDEAGRSEVTRVVALWGLAALPAAANPLLVHAQSDAVPRLMVLRWIGFLLQLVGVGYFVGSTVAGPTSDPPSPLASTLTVIAVASFAAGQIVMYVAFARERAAARERRSESGADESRG